MFSACFCHFLPEKALFGRTFVVFPLFIITNDLYHTVFVGFKRRKTALVLLLYLWTTSVRQTFMVCGALSRTLWRDEELSDFLLQFIQASTCFSSSLGTCDNR
jgi:tryptophan-rich sensory protein